MLKILVTTYIQNNKRRKKKEYCGILKISMMSLVSKILTQLSKFKTNQKKGA